MNHDVVIIGGGMAGLTAAAYASKAGLSTIVIEKGNKAGGLVNSFSRNGFVFDGGIRAIENSGIVFPMFRQLGIELDMLSSTVSVGFGRDVVRLDSENCLKEYRDLICKKFPGNRSQVRAIIDEISAVMKYMDVLYGIDNPLFMDLKGNPKYVFKTILPWLLKYIVTMPKIARLNAPVDEYLAKFTDNQALIDMFAQHFFKKTPTFFALSYFSLYLDYMYPRGGTGMLPAKLEEFILRHGGTIRLDTEIRRIDPAKKAVYDANGVEYSYKKMIWAADLKFLYKNLDLDGSRGIMRDAVRDATCQASRSVRRDVKGLAGKVSEIESMAHNVSDKRGGDSVFTLFISSHLPPEFFAKIASPHFFYTPLTRGLSAAPISDIEVPSSKEKYTSDRKKLLDWLERHLNFNTYEISFPVLRDPSLAPKGKTGIIASVLMDYDLVRHFESLGYYEEFRSFCTKHIIEVLDAAIFPGFRQSVFDCFDSTPLSMESITGNTDGAITGWAFTNASIPAEHRMPAIAHSVHTPIPDVYQAGQWTFSPSGLPISILTGKLAADRLIKDLRIKTRQFST